MPSLVPGILVGAALGGVVGIVSLFVPAGAPEGPAPTTMVAPAPTKQGAPGALPATAAASGAAAGRSPNTVSVPNGTSGANGTASPSPAPETASPSGDARPGSETPGSSVGASPGAGGPQESEADYLRRAHTQVAGSPLQALAMAEAFPQKYPDGKLGQERELIAIEALAGLGRTAEARACAKVFLTLFPESAHRRRLEVLIPDLAGSEKKQAP